MTIEELSKRCNNQIELMSWCCGVTSRQMRRYIDGDYLPIQRAALARERVQKIRNLEIPKGK